MLSNYVSVIDRERLTKKDILLKGVSFYFRNLLFLASTTLLLIFILNLLHVDTSFLKYPIEVERNELIEKGVFQAMLLVVFFAPLIEELSFRLGISFKKRDLFISSVAFAYMMGALFFMNGYFDKIYIAVPLAFITGAIIYRLSQYFIENKRREFKQPAIWFSVLLFGFLHVSNYDITSVSLIPMYLMMCLPQVLMGLVLVYFRLNLGFMYAFGFHSLLNGFSFLMSLLIR